MRLVIARCSVDHTGRLSAHLPLATRLLLVKADGSVLVHSDGGAYKPLNWMSAPCVLVQEPGAWRVSNRTGESMTIHIQEILHDSSHDLGTDPGLVKDGVERHLQELLADRCTVLGDGWSLVRREYSRHRFWLSLAGHLNAPGSPIVAGGPTLARARAWRPAALASARLCRASTVASSSLSSAKGSVEPRASASSATCCSSSTCSLARREPDRPLNSRDFDECRAARYHYQTCA